MPDRRHKTAWRACLLLATLALAGVLPVGLPDAVFAQQPPVAPAALPIGGLLPLRAAIGALAEQLAPLGGPRSHFVFYPASPRSLLEGYVAHMLAARLRQRGLVAAASDALHRSPAYEPGAPPSKCLLLRAASLGASLLVEVADHMAEGERHASATVYDVNTGAQLSDLRIAFRLPPDLEALLAAEQTSAPPADQKWLSLFMEMFPAADAAEVTSSDYLAQTEADYLMQVGLWQEAAGGMLSAAAGQPTRRFMRAVFCLQMAGKTEAAKDSVQSLLRQWQYADNGPLYALNAWLLLRQGAPDDAVVLLDQARIWDMARPGLYAYARGLMAMENGDVARAEQSLVAAADLLPDVLFAQVEAARLYWNNSKLDRSAHYYRNATRIAQCTAQAWADLAVVLQASEDIDGAVAALRRAFRMRSDSLLIARHLSALLKLQGKHEDALDVARRAAEANPCHAGLLAAYGDSAAEAWLIQDAEQAFRDAVHADPTFYYAQVRLAAILALQRRYQEARVLLTDLLAQQPDYNAARVELGRMLGDLGHYDEALSLLTEAAKDPDEAIQARLAATRVYVNAGKPDEAIREAQIAASSSRDAETYATLADAFLAGGDAEKAETAARQAIENDPTSGQAYLALARALAAGGEVEQSREHLATALRFSPYSAEALQFSGELRLDEGDFRGCADMWTRALKLNPWNAELHRRLAEVLRQNLKDRAGALEHYRRCLELEDLRAEAAGPG